MEKADEPNKEEIYREEGVCGYFSWIEASLIEGEKRFMSFRKWIKEGSGSSHGLQSSESDKIHKGPPQSSIK